MRFFESMTQSQIAQRVEASQMPIFANARADRRLAPRPRLGRGRYGSARLTVAFTHRGSFRDVRLGLDSHRPHEGAVRHPISGLPRMSTCAANASAVISNVLGVKAARVDGVAGRRKRPGYRRAGGGW
ncbi:hypothetical protein [Nocardia nova]|uniref:hypothetical protein n=1 Tax=Nocardia nova TaxID=37330 RepID=UPI003404A62F